MILILGDQYFSNASSSAETEVKNFLGDKPTPPLTGGKQTQSVSQGWPSWPGNICVSQGHRCHQRGCLLQLDLQ